MKTMEELEKMSTEDLIDLYDVDWDRMSDMRNKIDNLTINYEYLKEYLDKLHDLIETRSDK